jgi:calcineurin-like phosphoesterase family protein
MDEFVTADWQLGDPRLRILGRPFKTTLEMRDHLVRVHNEIVKPDDIVRVVGDSVFRHAPECLADLALFNGRKFLVRGNHERKFTDEQLLQYFEEVIGDGDGVELDIEGLKCWLTHYPTTGRKDRFNLVGHVHSLRHDLQAPGSRHLGCLRRRERGVQKRTRSQDQRLSKPE